ASSRTAASGASFPKPEGRNSGPLSSALRMTRNRFRRLLLGALLLAQAAHAGEVAAPAPAQRIVSMNPSLTRILVALGAGDALVGVDDFSAKAEPSVAKLPRVGGLYSPSLESVVALRPDLVVIVPSLEQRDFRTRLEA